MASDTRTVDTGIFRVVDGSPVEVGDATEAWVHAARGVLTELARTHQATITYSELAVQVQAASGIRTRARAANWIGAVLGAVSRAGYSEGEPLVASLCVRPDGTAGPGYPAAVKATYGTAVVTDGDIARHAADERNKCYEFFGAEMPVVEHVAPPPPKRRTAVRPLAAYVPPRSCPVCSMVLPLAGKCVNCRAGH